MHLFKWLHLVALGDHLSCEFLITLGGFCHLRRLVLGICPRGGHRDDDIMIISITYIMSSMNIHYSQTCIE